MIKSRTSQSSFWDDVPLIVLLALLVGYFYLGFHLPIYTDEIGWKITSSRYLLNHGSSLSLIPQCNPTNFLVKIPIVFLLAALVESVLYQNLSYLLKLRWLSCLNQLLYFLTLFFICKKLNRAYNFASANKVFVFSACILLLGVLPLNLFLNRPEQSLSLFLSVLLFLSLVKAPKKIHQINLCFLFMFFVSYFFYIHVKALFLLPAIILMALNLNLPKPFRAFVLFFLMVCAWKCFSFFSEKTICPAYPTLANFISTHMIAPDDFVNAPQQAMLKVFANLSSFKTYIFGILFTKRQGLWLPEILRWGNWVAIINAAIKYLVYFWLALLLVETIKATKESRPRVWISWALVLGVLAISGTMGRKSAYESNFIFPIFILINVLIFSSLPASKTCRLNRLWQGFYLVFIFFAITNSLLNFYFFAPYLSTYWVKGGRINELAEGYSAFKFKPIQSEISNLAGRCKINPHTAHKQLIVDNLTYTVFWDKPEPIYIHYFDFEKAERENIFFDVGLISHCSTLPKKILNKSLRDGEFCCIPFGK